MEQTKSLSIFSILPLLGTIALVPLACSLHFDELTTLEDQLIQASPFADFYSYYKATILKVGTFFSLCIFLLHLHKKQVVLEIDWFFIALILYAAITIISSVASPYQEIVYNGIKENYEGLWVILSYIGLAIMASSYGRSTKVRKWIINTVFLSAWFVAVITFVVFYDNGFFIQKWLQPIFFSEALQKNIPIKLQSNPYAFVGTLYNPNFLAAYSLLIYFLTTWFINEKKNIWRYTYKALNIIYIIIILGTKSGAALLGVVVGIGVLLIFTEKFLKTLRWLLISVSIGIIVHCIQFALLKQLPLFDESDKSLSAIISVFVVIVVFSYAINYLKEKNQLTWKCLKLILISIVIFVSTLIVAIYQYQVSDSPYFIYKSHLLEKIALQKNKIYFKEKGKKGVYIQVQNGDISVVDDTKQALAILMNSQNEIEFLDEDLKSTYIKMSASEEDVYSFIIMPYNFNLLFKKGEFIYKVANQEYNSTDDVGSIGFKGLENFASYRGYIWSRLLPKIIDKFWLGYGLGSTAFIFPHNEFLMRYNIGFDQSQIVYKPHNWYLQLIISSGIFALIIIGFLCLKYLFISFQLHFRILNSLHLSITVALLSYSLVCIFYDSYVGVAPLFWVFLGLGVAMLNTTKKENAPCKTSHPL